MAAVEGADPREPRPSSLVPGASRHWLRREGLASLGRCTLLIVVCSCLYALAPLGRRVDGTVALQLTAWLLVFAAIIVWQLRAVLRSPHPGLRASEAVVMGVPVLILIFAAAYFVAGSVNPAGFSEPLSRIDALYFSVTIFATVGFGDIAARGDEARMLVTAQMLTDLVVIGFIAKILFGVVQHRRRELESISEED